MVKRTTRSMQSASRLLTTQVVKAPPDVSAMRWTFKSFGAVDL